MAVRFRLIGPRPEEDGLDRAALAFLRFACAIVRGDARELSAAGVPRLPGGRVAVARHPCGQRSLIASSALPDFHAVEAMLDLMRRCRWRDFQYMYVEEEPCHGGAFSRPVGGGCRDQLIAALPLSEGIVFFGRGGSPGFAGRGDGAQRSPPDRPIG